MKLSFSGYSRLLAVTRVTVVLLCVTSIGVDASAPVTDPKAIAKARELYTERQNLDRSLWRGEDLAQQFEKRITKLWNALLKSDDKYSVLASFPFSKLTIAAPVKTQKLRLGVLRTLYSAGGETLTQQQLGKRLAAFKAAGYEIIQTEWHHSGFVPPTKNSVGLSEVSFEIHAARVKPAHRLIIKGQLNIEWFAKPDAKGFSVANVITVKTLEILERHAAPAFREVFTVKSTEKAPRILPLHVYDLDNDGLSEIIVAGQNLLFWNKGAGKFEADKFLKDERSLFDAGVIADFTGDSFVDFIGVDTTGYPILFKGNAKGRFIEKGIRIADTHLKLPKTFTAGDIDADGDLDLYVANYKYAYRKGQMPTPYYDANDGYPAYLLQNDGNGKFTDITKTAGVDKKRNRRAYSSSLVDMDDDRDLDLVVVSDYSGLDMYLNDGTGKFSDVTDAMGLDRHFFGMGHTFGDYDLDGKLDMYVIGMSSTTARRLDKLGLNRPDMPKHNAMRKVMGYGNRIFTRDKGEFKTAAINSAVARTGWSWGASSFDFDNDGDKDIFVANGHYSGKSTQDYCSTFWRHDIYEQSKPSPALDTLFQLTSKSLREADISWNGYEHKVLLANNGNNQFINLAFLMGVAFEYDGRAVIADDLDADGRVDLLVVEFKTVGLNRNSFVLHVYQNTLEEAGHWIGARLRDYGPGLSPIGAKITVKDKAGSQLTQIVTGDSFSSQHPATVHFGLGDITKVDHIEVRWPNGKISRLNNPEADKYHWVKPPSSKIQ